MRKHHPAEQIVVALLSEQGDDIPRTGPAPEDDAGAVDWLMQNTKDLQYADHKDHASQHGERNLAAAPVEEWEQYEEWEEYGAWQLRAIQELQEATDLVFSLDDEDGSELTLRSRGNREYLVFENEEAAQRHTIQYVEDLLDSEMETFNKDWLSNFIDKEKLRKTLWSDVYDMAYEDIESEGPPEDQPEDEPFDVDTLARQRADSRLEDPVEYLKEIYTEAEAATFISNNGCIDVAAAARDAVRSDGVAHFLASYDGNEITLPSGAVAYRTH